MAASNVFSGLGIKTLRTIPLIDREFYYKDSYYNNVRRDMEKIEGIGIDTVDYILFNLPNFWVWLDEVGLKMKNKEEVKDKLTGKSFCFSGIRSGEYEEKIIRLGGRVVTSVSSSLTMLIVGGNNFETNSKYIKATSLGVQVVSIDYLKNYIDGIEL